MRVAQGEARTAWPEHPATGPSGSVPPCTGEMGRPAAPPNPHHTSTAAPTCWKVEREDRMEPPIQTLYLRSGGATTADGVGWAVRTSERLGTTKGSCIPALLTAGRTA